MAAFSTDNYQDNSCYSSALTFSARWYSFVVLKKTGVACESLKYTDMANMKKPCFSKYNHYSAQKQEAKAKSKF